MKAIALITTACFSGCSFFAVRGPGDNFESMQNCTESYEIPTSELIGAGLFTAGSVGLFIAGATGGSGCDDGDNEGHGYGFDFCIDTSTLATVGCVLLAIPTLITLFSSLSGIEKVSKCRRAREQWREQNRTSQLIDKVIHSSSF